MVYLGSDGTIKFTKGDSVQLNLGVYKNNTDKYPIKNTDVVKFFLFPKDKDSTAVTKPIFTKNFKQVDLYGHPDTIDIYIGASNTIPKKISDIASTKRSISKSSLLDTKGFSSSIISLANQYLYIALPLNPELGDFVLDNLFISKTATAEAIPVKFSASYDKAAGYMIYYTDKFADPYPDPGRSYTFNITETANIVSTRIESTDTNWIKYGEYFYKIIMEYTVKYKDEYGLTRTKKEVETVTSGRLFLEK